MKQGLFIIACAVVLLLTGCDNSKETDFSSNLHKVTIGMSMQDVEELLGKPDIIETLEDHGGISGKTWLSGTSEVWSYGEDGWDGQIYFDTNRKVELVAEHQSRIAPPE